jgi:hypothetical protein
VNGGGELDLSHCRIAGTLRLRHATVKGRILLDGANITQIDAADADIDGSLHCRDGYLAAGLYVSLAGGEQRVLGLALAFFEPCASDR